MRQQAIKSPVLTLCWNCEKHPITRKDYRTDEYGTTSKVLSCEYCMSLNDMWHYRVRAEGLDPKKILLEE